MSKNTETSHQPDHLAIPDILTAQGDRHHPYVTETEMEEVVDMTIQKVHNRTQLFQQSKFHCTYNNCMLNIVESVLIVEQKIVGFYFIHI